MIAAIVAEVFTSEAPTIAAVARAAAEISGGVLAGAVVQPWPRVHSHHAFLLSTAAGQFVMRVHKHEHPGRMRRLNRVLELLAAHDVPHARVRWWDLEARTLPNAYYVQEFLYGEDAAQVMALLSPDDHARFGAEFGAGLKRLHAIEYIDTPTPWAVEFDERMKIRLAECVTLGALSEPERRRVERYYADRRGALDEIPRMLTHDDVSLANLLLEHRTDGWHFAAFLDFERTRGRDPWLDLARVRSLVFDRYPAAQAGFDGAYVECASPTDAQRVRLELYGVYLLVWGVPWSRQAELATREAGYRRRLALWLDTH